MKVDDTMTALVCIMIICVVAIIVMGVAAKDIALSLGSGIIGFLSAKSIYQKNDIPLS